MAGLLALAATAAQELLALVLVAVVLLPQRRAHLGMRHARGMSSATAWRLPALAEACHAARARDGFEQYKGVLEYLSRYGIR